METESPHRLSEDSFKEFKGSDDPPLESARNSLDIEPQTRPKRPHPGPASSTSPFSPSSALASSPTKSSPPHPRPTTFCSCGRIFAEAKALGCQFDTLAACRLLAVCRDDALAREFGPGPDGRRTYCADKPGTRELTIAEVAELPRTTGCFWASQWWHVLHCSFYRRKLRPQRETILFMK